MPPLPRQRSKEVFSIGPNGTPRIREELVPWSPSRAADVQELQPMRVNSILEEEVEPATDAEDQRVQDPRRRSKIWTPERANELFTELMLTVFVERAALLRERGGDVKFAIGDEIVSGG